MATPETKTVHLQYNGERRFFIVWVVVVQVGAYLVTIGTAAAGINSVIGGNRDGAAWFFLGVLGFGTAVLVCAGLAKALCRPRLWVDFEAQTISSNHLSISPIVDVLTFAEAEQMRLAEGFLSPFWLVGPRTDLTGRLNPKGHFGIASGYDDRHGGGPHFLADLLPTPLAYASNTLMIVDEVDWSDGLKFALFLNLPGLWNAGRTTIEP